MDTIKAIIVDDHASFRRSLQQLVKKMGCIDVVGEAADGLQARQMAVKLRPQLALMDICMPKMNGTDSCRAMKRDNESLWVVLYSADTLEVDSADAQGMADFCLTKESLFDELPAWIGATFTVSQRQTFPNPWPKLARSLGVPWRQALTDLVASQTNRAWLASLIDANRIQAGSAIRRVSLNSITTEPATPLVCQPDNRLLFSGVIAHWQRLAGLVSELYGAGMLPRVACPMAVGIESDELPRMLTVSEEELL